MPPSTQRKPRAFAARFVYSLRVICAGVAFLGFGLGAPLVGLSLSLFWLAGGTLVERRTRCQRVVGGSFRVFHAYMDAMGLILYRPRLELPRRSGPRVIVANHPTLVDVTALLSAYPEACCLVKSFYYDNPLFYLIMKFCGHIRVGQSRTDSGSQALVQASERLSQGSDVLLFPEGTRSPVGSLGPFHAGAFAVAVHSEVPVAPVAIFSAQPVLKRGTPWYLIPPEPVSLELVSLGHTVGKQGESIHHFTDRVRNQIIEQLASPLHDTRRDPD
jgi:1-acyl-sn-glycerol-3-phosphate acyltransferase